VALPRNTPLCPVVGLKRGLPSASRGPWSSRECPSWRAGVLQPN
jgi:hypothetical protein